MPSFLLPTHNREKAHPISFNTGRMASLDELVAWRVVIEPVQIDRTLQQNRYLNGVAYKMISEVTGYERQEIHEYASLRLFFGWRQKKVPRKPSNPRKALSPCQCEPRPSMRQASVGCCPRKTFGSTWNSCRDLLPRKCSWSFQILTRH